MSTISKPIPVSEEDSTGAGDTYGRLESIEARSIVCCVRKVRGAITTEVCGDISR